MSELLALTSAGAIGIVDFLGGALARRASAVRIVALVQIVGTLIALPVALLVGWDRVSLADVAYATLAGLAAAIGLWLFYLAMARGLIGVVAAIAAVTGATLPVGYGLLLGERPGTLALAGMALALIAITAATVAPGEQRTGALVVVLSVVAGLLFGGFYIAYARLSGDAGLWPIVIHRSVAALVLLPIAVIGTRGIALPLRLAPSIVVMGALEVLAASALLLALGSGTVAIVAVLASLYPVVTVALAALMLGERLSRAQLGAVALALVAVALVSTR